jgi:hypothetical protein
MQTGVNGFSLNDLRTMIQDTYEFVGDRLGIRLGKIRLGYAADFVTLPYLPPTPIDADNAFGHVFFGVFPGFKPKNVFVAGKRMITDYRLDPELDAKAKTTALAAARCWNELKKDGTNDESND